ncbi:hypothetical protein [Atlantibacter sp.]|uniref:hypothetical protein n=1 Tax=Atlantibacter sp. TaxID=1903473 RepID=UPI002898FF76|nr:hypothetical protein [Atlantibacter sp.]
MENDLQDALLDVRRAYRLIEDFQRRLISALEFMRAELNVDNYYQYAPNSVPRSVTGALGENGGRRYLPFNDLSVFWLKHSGQADPYNNPQHGDFMIDVWLRNDSGNGQRDGEYALPEASRSLLIIHVISCKTHNAGKQNWYDVWSNHAYPTSDEVEPIEKYEGFNIYRQEIDMVNLSDKDTFSACINAFRQRVSDKMGISFL